MKKIFPSCILLLFFIGHSFAQSSTDRFTLSSKKIKNGKYLVEVIVPTHYDSTQAYPICYFLDMQLAEELMKEINDSLQGQPSITPYIFVGIKCQENDKWCSLQRTRDFTPTYSAAMDAELKRSDTEDEISGGAAHFLSFLEKELIPTVEKKYKVIPEQRTLYGMSLSGLFASYAMLKRPYLFYQYIIGAPSLWYNNSAILEEFQNTPPEKLKHIRLYMGIGDLDAPIMYNNFELLSDTLKKKKVSFTSEVYPGKDHVGIWRIHLTNGISTIFHKP